MDENRKKARELVLEEAERGPTEEQKAKVRRDVLELHERLQALDEPQAPAGDPDREGDDGVRDGGSRIAFLSLLGLIYVGLR